MSVFDIEKHEEELATEYCKDVLGKNCYRCPYNRQIRKEKDDKCYNFWLTHNPNSRDYIKPKESENTE